MKIGELKDLLVGYSDDLEIGFISSFNDCNGCCNEDGRCYCTSEDHEFYITDMAKHVVYNKKTKKQELVGIMIRGEKQ